MVIRRKARGNSGPAHATQKVDGSVCNRYNYSSIPGYNWRNIYFTGFKPLKGRGKQIVCSSCMDNIIHLLASCLYNMPRSSVGSSVPVALLWVRFPRRTNVCVLCGCTVSQDFIYKNENLHKSSLIIILIVLCFVLLK